MEYLKHLLTEQERDVANRILDGLTFCEVAEELELSRRKVYRIRQKIAEKLIDEIDNPGNSMDWKHIKRPKSKNRGTII